MTREGRFKSVFFRPSLGLKAAFDSSDAVFVFRGKDQQKEGLLTWSKVQFQFTGDDDVERLLGVFSMWRSCVSVSAHFSVCRQRLLPFGKKPARSCRMFTHRLWPFPLLPLSLRYRWRCWWWISPDPTGQWMNPEHGLSVSLSPGLFWMVWDLSWAILLRFLPEDSGHQPQHRNLKWVS